MGGGVEWGGVWGGGGGALLAGGAGLLLWYALVRYNESTEKFTVLSRIVRERCARQAARFLRFGRGIRRSKSPRSGFLSSSCAAMRLHTLRQISTIAGSAAR